MIPKILRREFIFHAILMSSVLILFLLLVGGMSMLKQSKIQEAADLKQKTTQLTGRMVMAEARYNEYKKAMDLYQNLSSQKRKREGLKFDTARYMLDQLKERFYITDLNINMSVPVMLTEQYQKQTMGVEANNVELQFQGVNDVLILSFIGTILDNFPGFIQVTSLQLSRTQEYTKELADQIAKTGPIPLVSASMTFEWKDLKDTKNLGR